MKIEFGINKLKLCHTFDEHLSEKQISSFPQILRGDEQFSNSFGNYLLDRIIEEAKKNVSKEYKFMSVDTRSHMLLNKDWYPCIPGFHCDDFYRDSNGIPILENINEEAPMEHFSVVFGDNSYTEFVETQNFHLHLPKENRYKYLNQDIERKIRNKELSTFLVKNGELWKFGPTEIHRGTPSTHPGWRLFVRVSFSNHHKSINEIRNCTQIYLINTDGW